MDHKIKKYAKRGDVVISDLGGSVCVGPSMPGEVTLRQLSGGPPSDDAAHSITIGAVLAARLGALLLSQAKEMGVSDAETWSDHLGVVSPPKLRDPPPLPNRMPQPRQDT